MAAASPVLVRASRATFLELVELLFSRYPEREWAAFARFGWRPTSRGLVLTLAAIDKPERGELDAAVPHVAIQESYSLRIALATDEHPLGVGVVHSHPRGSLTLPSHIDDGMDQYYAKYFADFAPGRPYSSLIFGQRGPALYGTGRVFWEGQWHSVGRFAVEGLDVRVDEPVHEHGASVRRRNFASVARLVSAFGGEAAERLSRSTVGVVGAGGTGSPAIEVLARAGVGEIIGIDPDHFSESNLERVHGSGEQDVVSRPAKVAIARRHVESISAHTRLTLIQGRVPQAEVVDALAHADVIIGCTDQQHSRLALCDLATRYLIPTLDCGVSLEGNEGRITGQVIQLTRMLPTDPCALCRDMISPVRLSQELMSTEERERRIAAAGAAATRGENAGQYWQHEVQLNTVGYITTTAGALAAGYAIGWISGRFEPPFTRLQMNLVAPFLDVTDADVSPRASCPCRRLIGMADQGAADALITAPKHWPIPVFS